MALCVVERTFEEPCDAVALQAQEDAGAWCLEMHRVTYVRTWFSRDGLRMLCLYDAPDAESVRTAQRTITMPMDRVWAAEPLLDESTPSDVVVVEAALPAEVRLSTMPDIRQAYSSSAAELLAVFGTDDVATVKRVCADADLTVTRIWPAAHITPPA